METAADDPEIIPDNEYKTDRLGDGRAAAAPARIVVDVPPEATTGDFGDRMDMMLNTKIGRLGAEVTTSMNPMEARLGTRPQEETEECKKEGRETNARVNEVMERIKRLEMAEGDKNAAASRLG